MTPNFDWKIMAGKAFKEGAYSLFGAALLTGLALSAFEKYGWVFWPEEFTGQIGLAVVSVLTGVLKGVRNTVREWFDKPSPPFLPVLLFSALLVTGCETFNPGLNIGLGFENGGLGVNIEIRLKPEEAVEKPEPHDNNYFVLDGNDLVITED